MSAENLIGKTIGDLKILDEVNKVMTLQCLAPKPDGGICGNIIHRSRGSLIASRAHGHRAACKKCVLARVKKHCRPGYAFTGPLRLK